MTLVINAFHPSLWVTKDRRMHVSDIHTNSHKIYRIPAYRKYFLEKIHVFEMNGVLRCSSQNNKLPVDIRRMMFEMGC